MEKLRAFYWEGEKNSKVSQTGKQLQIVVIFAKTQEEAVQFFYEKEGGEGNTIRECLDELLEFTEPVELSLGMAEIAATLLWTFHSSSKLYYEEHLKKQGIASDPTNIHKLYRYTPGRILYMLAKTEEAKKKPKEVKVIDIDDLE